MPWLAMQLRPEVPGRESGTEAARGHTSRDPVVARQRTWSQHGDKPDT
jgi:hypothetical protein